MSIDDLLSSMDTSALTSASNMPGSFTDAIDTMHTALSSGDIDTTPPPTPDLDTFMPRSERKPEL